ncbi:MAG: hypothetical protein JST08_14280 [Actinobacteria bacterium]|nr:hypothetical protein [Actinomycetota bacterium]
MKQGMLSVPALVAVVAGMLIGVSSSAAQAPAPTTTQETTSGPAYKHYIACGLSRKAKPATVCPVGSKKGAFFKSLKADVKYTVCVKFPKKEHLCTEKPQVAEQGTLYVNKITSTTPGRHQVTWFVKGKKVGTSVFRVK